MDCQSCGERNDADMLFCIYCGQNLRQPKNGHGEAPAGQGSTCTNCGHKDALSSQFCVMCGARMVASTAHHAAQQDLGEHTFTHLRPSSDGSPTAYHPVSRMQMWLVVAAAAAAGAVVGAIIASVYLPPEMRKNLATADWGTSGLVVYTKQPYTPVTLEFPDHRTFWFAKTGQNGGVRFGDVAAGTYDVRAGEPGANQIHKTATLTAKGAVALGYPIRLGAEKPTE